MISLRGPKLQIFAGILAVICLAAGIYFTFFHSRGFVKNTAVIVSLELVEGVGDEEDTYYPVVEHKVDGRTYTGRLDQSGPSDEVGKTITILYDPEDPSNVHGGIGIGIYLIAVSAAILAFVIFSTIRERQSQKQFREMRASGGREGYLPSVQGEERELYFLTDLGTAKYGHRIEDGQRRVLYEAKMTKFTLTGPFGFDFIDHEHGTSTPHLVGHSEESEWDTFLIDNHYTFELDGVDVFRHLKQNGVHVETSLGGDGRLGAVSCIIFRDGEEIARAVSTSQYPHEEDEAQHKVADRVATQGFYRIWTREQNLDLLFVTLLAFARSGALDDKGGIYGAFGL